jgi:hypothetical protein
VSGLLLVLTGALSVGMLFVGARARRLGLRVAELEGELAQARAEATKLVSDRDYFEGRVRTLKEDLERTTAERDSFRDIASDRELPVPAAHPAPRRILEPLWVDREYNNHPAVNLQRLGEDLDSVGEDVDGDVVLEVCFDPEGGWRRRSRELVPQRFLGSRERVLEDLRCWLMDDDLRLTERRSEGAVWSDPDSPLRFVASLSRVTEEVPVVHVHEVRVATVETRVEERIIEQPVIIEVPTARPTEGELSVQVGLSREEVLALFEVELESKLAEFALDRVAATERERVLRGRKRQQHAAVLAKKTRG